MSNILTNNINPRSGNLITIGGVNDRVSVAGTLSYNDVTNIDSVGIITARDGLDTPTNLVLRTGGTEKVRIDSSGNFGIGETNPTQLLVLKSAAPRMRLIDSDVSTGGQVSGSNGNLSLTYDVLGVGGKNFSISDSTSTRLLIDSSGKVGINEATPSAILDVRGTVSAGGGNNEDLQEWSIGSDNVKAEIKYIDTAANRGMLFGTTTDHVLAFQSNNAERMRIDSSGRLLAGTSSTSADTRAIIQGRSSAADSTGRLYISSGNNAPAIGDGIAELYFSSSAHVASARITAQRDGGTWTAGSSLPTRLVVSTTENGSSSPSERMRISSQGTLSVRANATQQARWGSLDGASFQNSENYTIIYGNSANSYVLTRACNTADGTPVFDAYVGGSRQIEIEADGGVNSQGDYTNISDQRLKENIVDSSSQWDDIKALRVRNFNFTEASGYPTVTKIGFIAQEVEQVSPGLVKTRSSYTEDGEEIPGTDIKIVKSSVVTTKAIKALQEAMARIETLEQRLTDAGL